MRQHLVVWLIALAAVALASVVHVSRQTTARTSELPSNPQAVIEHAIDLLQTDPNALREATQRAIRAAAVLADEGTVTSAEGAYLLGRQYEREHDIKSAEARYKKAISLDPEWNWPYGSLGYLLAQHSFGRAEEAKEVLRKCIALDPTWGRPYNIMAVIFRAEGDMDSALEYAQKSLDYWPDSIVPLNNYANLLVALERYEEAETYFRRAIEAFPEHPKPYYNLACLYTLMGRKEDTLKNLQESFRRSDALRYEALDDPDFESLRDDPDFEALVDRDRPVTSGSSA